MSNQRTGAKPRVVRRYPIEPVARALGVSLSPPRGGAEPVRGLPSLLGISGSTWKEYRDRGVSELVAERLAKKVGLPVHSLWPEMIAHEIEDSSVPCRECGELFVPARSRHYYCTSLCGRRARDRVAKATARRGESAEQRAARKAYLAAYRAAYGESLNRQRRARYRANREQELARQREYDATVRRARRAGQRVQREAATEPRREAA